MEVGAKRANRGTGAGQMVWQLGALVTLAERFQVQFLVPTCWLTTTCNTISRRSGKLKDFW